MLRPVSSDVATAARASVSSVSAPTSPLLIRPSSLADLAGGLVDVGGERDHLVAGLPRRHRRSLPARDPSAGFPGSPRPRRQRRWPGCPTTTADRKPQCSKTGGRTRAERGERPAGSADVAGSRVTRQCGKACSHVTDAQAEIKERLARFVDAVGHLLPLRAAGGDPRHRAVVLLTTDAARIDGCLEFCLVLGRVCAARSWPDRKRAATPAPPRSHVAGSRGASSPAHPAP